MFGFSDGATVAIELLTTRRFRGAVVAAYGFTGVLPPRAVERLAGVPLWVFHSADDVIFDVANADCRVAATRSRCLRDALSLGAAERERARRQADRLVAALRKASDADVRFSRFAEDQEGFTGAVRGHSTGITASKRADVWEWLLTL